LILSGSESTSFPSVVASLASVGFDTWRVAGERTGREADLGLVDVMAVMKGYKALWKPFRLRSDSPWSFGKELASQN